MTHSTDQLIERWLLDTTATYTDSQGMHDAFPPERQYRFLAADIDLAAATAEAEKLLNDIKAAIPPSASGHGVTIYLYAAEMLEMDCDDSSLILADSPSGAAAFRFDDLTDPVFAIEEEDT